MSTLRKRLPDRRDSRVFRLKWNDATWHCRYSRHQSAAYPVSPIAEVFLHGAKTGSHMDAIGYTTGATISIALQHGVPLAELQKASARLERGYPADLIAAVLDHLLFFQTEGDDADHTSDEWRSKYPHLFQEQP